MDINATGPDGLPIIFWTIKEGDTKKLQALLRAGYNIEIQGYHKATPILSAAIIDNWEIVFLLYQNKARLSVADGRGFTLPWIAKNTKVAAHSSTKKALEQITNALEKHGLMKKVYKPEQVRQMMKDKTWPPPDWKN